MPRIWKKWSMTQSESNPASSALRTMRASVGPMAVVPPGQLNRLIWRPIFMPPVSQVGLVWISACTRSARPLHMLGGLGGHPARDELGRSEVGEGLVGPDRVVCPLPTAERPIEAGEVRFAPG